MDVGNLLAVFQFLHVDGQQPGNPGNRALRSVNRDALTPYQRVVDTTDPLDREKTLLGYMRDHEPELVHMATDEDCWVTISTARIQCRVGIPVGVDLYGISEGPYIVDPHLLSPCLKSRGGRRVEQGLEKLVWGGLGIGFHVNRFTAKA